jgi:hypothetical protein
MRNQSRVAGAYLPGSTTEFSLFGIGMTAEDFAAAYPDRRPVFFGELAEDDDYTPDADEEAEDVNA